MFNLHSQLVNDGIWIGDFELSTLLLMNDRQFPWFILVPRREDVTEIFQLDQEDRVQLLNESCWLAEALKDGFAAHKINVAALGNMVSQLHIHHIVRYREDPAWPAPVWGKLPPVAYGEEQLNECVSRLQAVLTANFTYAERFSR
ncbi:HIT domain-containing protein [Halopseudomonas xiamenensis]|uniref:HIT domain-containing protein n=1 Tax=Halopseudomonas xiamenensis TaxID=157792 RepID=UPI001629B14F|nr:HIT domain-containing protein [Halopseudomonas xiamenensis]